MAEVGEPLIVPDMDPVVEIAVAAPESEIDDTGKVFIETVEATSDGEMMSGVDVEANKLAATT